MPTLNSSTTKIKKSYTVSRDEILSLLPKSDLPSHASVSMYYSNDENGNMTGVEIEIEYFQLGATKWD